MSAKLRSAINMPFEIDGKTVVIGSSIGSACYPDDGQNAEDMLAHADKQMYRVKRTMRGAA